MSNKVFFSETAEALNANDLVFLAINMQSWDLLLL